MKYNQINVNRLTTVLNTLDAAREMLRDQGVLGSVAGNCRNRQHIIEGDSSRDIGCLVGCLVGVEEFACDDSQMASELNEDLVEKAYNRAWRFTPCVPFKNLSSLDRESYQRLLGSLQVLHDKSYTFGFESDIEYVLFALRLMRIHFDLILRCAQNPCYSDDEVVPFTISMNLPTSGYIDANQVHQNIVTDVLGFISKK